MIAIVELDGNQRRHLINVKHTYSAWREAHITVQLNVLPLDGRIILLERDAADDRRLEAEAKRFATQSKARKGGSP